jgi:hypothetical protein
MKYEQLNYDQLCKKFGEEKKEKGNRRAKQFEKWRREWYIDKIKGKNKYLVRPLSLKEKQSANIVNFSYQKLIEPMVYDLCSNAEGKFIDTTYLEQQELLGLVNPEFKYIKQLAVVMAEEIGVKVEELKNFKAEAQKLNQVTISNVIKSMVRKGILNTEKIFKVKYKGDEEWTSLTGDQMQEVEDYRNYITRVLTDEKSKYFVNIKDEDKRKTIFNAVNDHFGFECCYDGERWWLDKDTIKIVFEDSYSFLLNKLKVNENNQIKISRSTRGNLKHINSHDKNVMIDKTIKID